MRSSRILLSLTISTIAPALAPTIPAFAAATVPAGSLRVVLPGTNANLTHGSSGTEFGLMLPSGARCPGDTKHDGYYVFGYLVPLSVQPGTIEFNQLVPSQGFDLYYEGSNEPWGPVNTYPDTAQIPDLPNNFAWSRLGAENLLQPGQQSASWTLGVGCALREVISTHWDVEMTFTRDSADPKGYVWSVQHEAKAPPPGFPWLAAGPLVLAALMGLASIAMYRRSRPPTQSGPDPLPREEVAHV